MMSNKKRAEMADAVQQYLQSNDNQARQAQLSKASDDEAAGMVMTQLRKLMEQAAALRVAIRMGREVEPWVYEAITKAETHLQGAHDYMLYNEEPPEEQEEYEVDAKCKKTKKT